MLMRWFWGSPYVLCQCIEASIEVQKDGVESIQVGEQEFIHVPGGWCIPNLTGTEALQLVGHSCRLIAHVINNLVSKLFLSSVSCSSKWWNLSRGWWESLIYSESVRNKGQPGLAVGIWGRGSPWDLTLSLGRPSWCLRNAWWGKNLHTFGNQK